MALRKDLPQLLPDHAEHELVRLWQAVGLTPAHLRTVLGVGRAEAERILLGQQELTLMRAKLMMPYLGMRWPDLNLMHQFFAVDTRVPAPVETHPPKPRGRLPGRIAAQRVADAKRAMERECMSHIAACRVALMDAMPLPVADDVGALVAGVRESLTLGLEPEQIPVVLRLYASKVSAALADGVWRRAAPELQAKLLAYADANPDALTTRYDFIAACAGSGERMAASTLMAEAQSRATITQRKRGDSVNKQVATA